MKTETDATFGRNRRLPDKAAFDRVFRQAASSRDRAFTVLCRANGGHGARLGLIIAKKNCRGAVARNRLKRIIRESFRCHQPDLDGLDVIVMNKKGIESLNNAELFDSLAAHWQRCRRAGNRAQEKR